MNMLNVELQEYVLRKAWFVTHVQIGEQTNGEVDCGFGVCESCEVFLCPLADVVSQLWNLQFPMDLAVHGEA